MASLISPASAAPSEVITTTNPKLVLIVVLTVLAAASLAALYDWLHYDEVRKTFQTYFVNLAKLHDKQDKDKSNIFQSPDDGGMRQSFNQDQTPESIAIAISVANDADRATRSLDDEKATDENEPPLKFTNPYGRTEAVSPGTWRRSCLDPFHMYGM